MPGRQYTSSDYRFGFNGKENDKDWGSQLIQDYGFRLYNPAIGKFLSVDPLAPSYPFYTPYQFAGNKPINSIDLEGLQELETIIHNSPANGTPGKAKIKITLNYYVITEGVGKVHNLPDPKRFNNLFEKGNITIGLRDISDIGSFMFESIFGEPSSSDYYSVDVEYQYNLIIEEGMTFEKANALRESNPSVGMVMIPRENGDLPKESDYAIPAFKKSSDELIESVTFNPEVSPTEANIIYLNKNFYGADASKTNLFTSEGPGGVGKFPDKTEVLVHGAGHNSAKVHQHGSGGFGLYEYNQPGLQSILHGAIFPTVQNTISILSDETNQSNNTYSIDVNPVGKR